MSFSIKEPNNQLEIFQLFVNYCFEFDLLKILHTMDSNKVHIYLSVIESHNCSCKFYYFVVKLLPMDVISWISFSFIKGMSLGLNDTIPQCRLHNN